MIEVEALQSFEHSGPRRRGERFHVSKGQAIALERARLVKVLGEGPTPANPFTAAGAKSSASPVAPVSLQTTAKPFGDGETKKQGRPKKEKTAEASS